MFKKEAQVNLQRQISNINWNQMFYFCMVASYGSLKSVSERLNLSSSTLSEHISQLEKSLGVTLFYRKGPKLTLSEEGQNLYLKASQMFEAGQKVLGAVAPLPMGSYPISIGVVPGPHIFTAHHYICEFTKAFGPLEMTIRQISQSTLESQLLQAGFDFGFSDQPSKRKDITSLRVSSSQIRFYVSAKWKEKSLREILHDIPLLICSSEASTDAILENALDQVDIHPVSIVRAEYPSILLDLCRKGLGVGTFSEEAIGHRDSETMRTLQNPKDAPKIQLHTYLLWPSANDSSQIVEKIKGLMQT